MVSYLNKESQESLKKIIDYIKTTDEYIKVDNLKKIIAKDNNLMATIEKVKELQKKYIRSNYDSKIKEQLDEVVNILNSNKVYLEYNFYLEKVNRMLDLVREELNDYFYKVTNSVIN